jgi:phosphatidylglycerol:prolipoprotein diacylglycerol transferase
MHPILLKIPLPGWKLPWFGELHSIPIHSYGVMLGLSLVVGWYLTLGLAEKDGMPKETMANCYVVTAISAVVMSRVLYFVTNPDEFKSFWELFALWRGGLVAYGGFLGGFLGSYVYLRRNKVPLLPWADVATPSLASGLLLTRIGCYLFGCDFGKPLSDGAPKWLKSLGTFPHWAEGTIPRGGTGSPAWLQHYAHNLVSADSAASLPVHPTQIYESVVGLVLLGLLLWVRKHQKFRGEVFLVFTFGYGVLRFLLEIVRDDAERGAFGPHLPEHIFISGILLLFGIAYIVFMAQAIAEPLMRRLTQGLAVLPAIIAFLLLQPPSFGDQTLLQLSTSQWIGILTGIPAAAFFAVFWKAAIAHPESAMKMHLDEFYAMQPKQPEANEAQAEPKQAERASASEPEPAAAEPGAAPSAEDAPAQAKEAE